MKKILQVSAILYAVIMQANVAYAENYNDRFIAEKAPVIAFTHTRVIDGTGAEVKERQTVIIEDGRITNIGNDGKVKIPKDAKRISLRGKSLLPGWVMTHEHLFYWNLPDNVPRSGHKLHNAPWIENVSQSISYPRLHLSAGVTSARTVGTFDPYADLTIRNSIDSGLLVGPDYDLSIFVFGRDVLGYLEKDVDGVREAVRFWVNRGFTSVKAHSVSGGKLEAIIDEAHKMGVKVTADLGQFIKNHREGIDFDIDQLEHVVALAEGSWDNAIPLESKRAQQHMQYYIDNNVAVSMTISEWDNVPAPDSVLELFNDRDRQRVLQDRLGPAFMADNLRDGKYLKRQQEVALAFWRQGGTITLGTDAVFGDHIAGYSNLRAVELTVDAGIPNLEVIKMATHNGAEAIGILNDRGTIEVGKRADLIVINGDPSTDIKAIYNIETVFKNGVGYDPEALKDSVKGTVGGPG